MTNEDRNLSERDRKRRELERRIRELEIEIDDRDRTARARAAKREAELRLRELEVELHERERWEREEQVRRETERQTRIQQEARDRVRERVAEPRSPRDRTTRVQPDAQLDRAEIEVTPLEDLAASEPPLHPTRKRKRQKNALQRWMGKFGRIAKVVAFAAIGFAVVSAGVWMSVVLVRLVLAGVLLFAGYLLFVRGRNEDEDD